MKGLISRLAVLFWVGYMGLVLGSILFRVGYDLFWVATFFAGLIFGSLIVLLIGWMLVFLVDALFGEVEDFILDFVWVKLIYWLGFFVGALLKVV